jgi:glutamate-ammonia-ligase adenylyltransferase
LLALTRLRAVAGDARLGARAEALAAATLARTRVGAAVLADAAEMRARMERERAGRGLWDLKLAPGGFVDIEFIAQAMHVAHSLRAPANTGDALDALARAGVLSQEDHALLSAAWRRASDLQQLLRICVDGEFDAAKAPEVLVQRLAQAGDAASLEQLEAILTGERAAVRAAFKRLIGPL